MSDTTTEIADAEYTVTFEKKQLYEGEFRRELPAMEVERMGDMTGVKFANGEHVDYNTDEIAIITPH